MGKLNEELKSKITFGKLSFVHKGINMIKIFCHYGELYRQYICYDVEDADEKNTVEEYAKNILTNYIEQDINKHNENI